MKKLKLHSGLPLYIIALLLLLASPAWSDSPTTQVKSAVDEAIKILSNPKLGGAAKKEERRRLLRETSFLHFDFAEMAKRSLGAHWRRRTAEEQTEFVKVFTDLLERTYMGRIESYNNEKFLYTGERIDQDYAEVNSRIMTSKGEEFRIDYKLHLVGNEWKIYDVVIEDISLVNNYRSQFNRIINESSYEELVSRMKHKLLAAADK